MVVVEVLNKVTTSVELVIGPLLIVEANEVLMSLVKPISVEFVTVDTNVGMAVVKIPVVVDSTVDALTVVDELLFPEVLSSDVKKFTVETVAVDVGEIVDVVVIKLELDIGSEVVSSDIDA